MRGLPAVQDAFSHASGVIEGAPPIHHDLQPTLLPCSRTLGVVYQQGHPLVLILNVRSGRDGVVVALDTNLLNLGALLHLHKKGNKKNDLCLKWGTIAFSG